MQVSFAQLLYLTIGAVFQLLQALVPPQKSLPFASESETILRSAVVLHKGQYTKTLAAQTCLWDLWPEPNESVVQVIRYDTKPQFAIPPAHHTSDRHTNRELLETANLF